MLSAMNEMSFRIIRATEALEVGAQYFLIDTYNQTTAKVTVLTKSTQRNAAGWPSSVEVEVVEQTEIKTPYHRMVYVIGSKHIVCATNLYKNREDANPRRRFRRRY